MIHRSCEANGPYDGSRGPGYKTVPLTTIILSLNEEANIERAVRSASWSDQILVVDSMSTDRTAAIAEAAGAAVVRQPWLGYAKQRDFALKHPAVNNEWVYFLDADEWVSADLADEIAVAVTKTSCAAYRQRRRLVFLGKWIKHCGWYSNSWLVKLMRRSCATYSSAETIGERVIVTGSIGQLQHDVVDEDCKGLANWLRKHVGYAELETQRRAELPSLRHRIRRLLACNDSRPLSRTIAKDIIYPGLPAKPVAIFLYTYLLRRGFLDGWPGLALCVYLAWYEFTISALARETQGTRARPDSQVKSSWSR